MKKKAEKVIDQTTNEAKKISIKKVEKQTALICHRA